MKYILAAIQILMRGQFVFLSFLLAIAHHTQAQNVAWANGITNTNDFISLKNICTNQLGETYTVGQFKNKVDFDAGPGFDTINANSITPLGNAGFITKTDNAGNHLWAKALIPYATNAGSIMYDVAEDMNGNVYVAGVYNKAIDFDPGAAIDSLNVSGTSGSFVMKLDAAGNFLWAKTFLDINTVMRSIKTDQNNNVIISGYFNVAVDFDPGPAVYNLTPANATEVCLVKLDTNGDFIWAKSWVNSRPNLGTLAKNNLDIDNGNNIYLSGKIINNTIDLDPGAGVYADSGKSFVLKIDASANFIWGHGTTASTSLVCVSKYSDLYVAGTPSGLASKTYLSKYDIAGTALWVKILPDSIVQGQYFTGNVHALNEDTSGNIVMGGKNNSSRYFLYTTDSSGLLSWYKNANGGTNTELSVKVNADNELLVAGNMSDVLDVDFGPAIDTVGMPNTNGFFLMKYNYCGSNHHMYYDGCDSLVLPDSTYFANANYLKEYLDVNNCDSNVFMHVTLHTLPDVLINACDTAFYNGQAYTQTGVYSQVIPNPYGCDSTVNITVNINTPTGLPPFLNQVQTFQPYHPAFPASSYITSYNIEVDSLFNMYISGSFGNSIDFNPLGVPYLDTSWAAYYQNDGFVTRYDSSGLLQWMHQLYTIDAWGVEVTPSLCLDDGLELYSSTYGTSGSNIGMNKVSQFAYANTYFGSTQMGNYTIWNVNQILNDPTSNLPVKIGFHDSIPGFQYAYKKMVVWRGNNMATFSTGGQYIGLNGAVDSQGNIYVVNSMQPVYNGVTYCMIAKLDSNLNMLWNKQIGEGSAFPPFGTLIDQLKVDTNGSLLLCGRFKDTLDMDISPNTYNLVSNGDYDAFIARFDTAANFIWAQSFGGADDDYANSITTDLNGRIYLGGSFSSPSIDLDPTAGISFLMKGCVNADWQGGYISKFKPDGTFMKAMGSGKNITELEFKAPKRIYATGIPFLQVFELGNDVIVNVSDTICAGDSVVVGNSVYYQTGVYTAIFPIAPAIDSIVITNLTVNPLPLVVANASDTSLCIGDSVVLSGSGANTYVWNNAVMDNVIFSPLATSNYLVTGTDINGCVNQDSIQIIVNMLPTITANATDTITCFGDSIILFGSGGVSYTWNNLVIDSVLFTPLATGYFVVTGTDTNSCVNTDSIEVIVHTLPLVIANASDTSLCPGDSVILFGTGALTYTWNNLVIDSMIFSPAITNTYLVAGTDTNGCVNTDSITVVVNALPNVVANASDTSVCIGNPVTLYGTGADSFSWTNSVIDSVAFYPIDTAMYVVTGADINGCVNQDSIEIVVNALPAITANATDTITCFGDSIILFGSGGMTYIWNNLVIDSVLFAPLATGYFAVTGTDTNGCINTDSIHVTVNALPLVEAVAADTSLCAGDSVMLFGTGALTYIWNNLVIDSMIFSPAITNSYLVAGTDTNGCVNTDSITVVVNALPNVVANASDTSVCIGNLVTLYGTGADSFSWTNSVIDSVAFYPIDTAMYVVTGIDVNGCVNQDSILVSAHQIPVPVLVFSGDTLYCTNVSGVTHYWFKDTVAVDSLVNYYVVTQNGNYQVLVVDSNGCVGADTISVVNLGNLNIDRFSQINVYPNPAHDQLSIVFEMHTDGDVEFMISDLTGKNLYKTKRTISISGKQVQKIDLRKLNINSGIYFLNMMIEGKRHVVKIELQKG